MVSIMSKVTFGPRVDYDGIATVEVSLDGDAVGELVKMTDSENAEWWTDSDVEDVIGLVFASTLREAKARLRKEAGDND